MEQLHFHPKFSAEEFLVTFVDTKVTPAAGNLKIKLKYLQNDNKQSKKMDLKNFKKGGFMV